MLLLHQDIHNCIASSLILLCVISRVVDLVELQMILSSHIFSHILFL